MFLLYFYISNQVIILQDQDGVVEGNDTLDAYCAKIQSQESCNQSDDEVVRTESFSEEDVARGSGDGKVIYE